MNEMFRKYLCTNPYTCNCYNYLRHRNVLMNAFTTSASSIMISSADFRVMGTLLGVFSCISAMNPLLVTLNFGELSLISSIYIVTLVFAFASFLSGF